MYNRKKVLFVGQNNSLLSLISMNNDTEVISSIKFLDSILFSFIPNLIVFNTLDDADIVAVRKNERLSFVPLLIVLENFDGFSAISSVSSFPKVLLCNTAVAQKKDFLLRLQNIMEKKGGILPAKSGAIVKNAIFFMNKHYGSAINRKDIAENCNVASDYLSRTFHKEMGVGLTAYLTCFRLNMARLMLIETALSVKEIAEKCGFASPAYFTNLFRSEFGVSPRLIRNK